MSATASAAALAPPSQPWWRNAGVLVAALAFGLSLATTIVAVVAAYQKDIHDQQAQLSKTVEKILQIPITRALAYSNGAFHGSLDQYFSNQSRMLALKGYHLALQLASRAPSPELMSLGDLLIDFENYAAAKQMYRQAVLSADNFSDEVSALRAKGHILIQWGADAAERDEGEAAFKAASEIGGKYPDIARDPAEIAYTNTLTQLSWVDAWSGRDCRQAEMHLGDAARFDRATGSATPTTLDGDVAHWREAMKHCDQDNRLPIEFRPMREPSPDSDPPPPIPVPASRLPPRP